jgi:hypothetical protein
MMLKSRSEIDELRRAESPGGAVTSNPKTTGARPGSYVIDLCSVAVPITIPQPRSAPLARYRFFLSHSREDGRKRYGLHMGYFTSAQEAEKWLTVLQRIYPQASVSQAPAGQADLLSDTQALAILEQTSRL